MIINMFNNLNIDVHNSIRLSSTFELEIIQ